jgi:hypothetical protein
VSWGLRPLPWLALKKCSRTRWLHTVLAAPLLHNTRSTYYCVSPPPPKVLSPTSFVRPIYAGNALATVAVAPHAQHLIMATVRGGRSGEGSVAAAAAAAGGHLCPPLSVGCLR